MTAAALLAAAWLAQLTGAGAARAVEPESVAMPFECSVDGVRVVMKPSEQRTYQVMGHREERQVTACSGPGANDCRTMMAHRFAISCGGRRIAWMRVVAAARHTASRDMWIEDGRIHLAVDRRGDTVDRCDGGMRQIHPRPYRDGGSSRFGLPMMECLPWQRGRRLATVSLPPGFAPLAEIGARIQIGGGQAGGGSVAAGPTVQPLQSLQSVQPVQLAAVTGPSHPLADIVTQAQQFPLEQETPRIERAHVSAESLPEVTPIPVVLTGADPSRTWITLVRPEAMAEVANLARGPSAVIWMAASALAAMLAAAAFAVWRMDRMPVASAARARADATGAFGESSGGARSSSAKTGNSSDTHSAHAGAAHSRPEAPPEAHPQHADAAKPDGDQSAKVQPSNGQPGAGFRDSLRTAASRFGGGAPKRPAETSVTNAAASVTALIEQANGSLDVLRGAPPLREVLEQEIGVIRQ
ncbi:MAG: hypothetical protein ABL908_18675, partial [Hyphomicrobium sp.]